MSVAAVGGAVAGGLIASSGAKSAAREQTSAANAANTLTDMQFRETQASQAPFRESGVAANSLLSQLLGLPGYENGAPPNAEAWIAEQAGKGYDEGYRLGNNTREQIVKGALDNYRLGLYGDPNAARKLFGYKQDTTAGPSANFGSLLKPFSQSDLDNDVIYQNTHQYAQDQGNLGVNRIAAASGSQLSGATLKALQRSGANIANQYGNDAFNRDQTQNTNTYNRLAGVSGSGQAATNQVNAAGANAASQIGNNLIGAANARGASAIAQGNALSGAIGQGINTYQQNNFLNSLSNFRSNPYNVNGAASGQF